MRVAIAPLLLLLPLPSLAAGQGASAPGGSPVAVSDAELVRQLIDQWSAQTEAIATASIRYRTYLAAIKRSDLTPEIVDALLSRFDLVGDPESFRGLLDELHRGIKPKSPRPDPPWFVREYSQLGNRRRDEYHSGYLHGQLRILDGTHDYLFEPGASRPQVTLHGRGGSSLMSPGMHLFLRDPSRDRPPESFAVASRGERIRLELVTSGATAGGWIEADPATGLMTRDVACYNGQVYEDHRQLGLTEYDGGIVLPAVSLRLDYRQGVLRKIFYRSMESAVFNGPIDEGLFAMPADPGTVLVDRRGPEPIVVRTVEPTNDVVSALATLGGAPSGPPEPRSSVWRWLLAANGLALVALSAVFWRRSRQSLKPQ